MTKRSPSDLMQNKAIKSSEIEVIRKPYESPRILSTEPLEAVAASCVVDENEFPPFAFGKDFDCLESQS